MHAPTMAQVVLLDIVGAIVVMMAIQKRTTRGMANTVATLQ